MGNSVVVNTVGFDPTNLGANPSSPSSFNIGESSNGRTPGSEPGNVGSNPASPSNFRRHDGLLR